MQNKTKHICQRVASILKAGSGSESAGNGVLFYVGWSAEASLGRGPVE